MEFRIRMKDIQWTALVLFIFYLIIVMCFVFNEIEQHAEDEQYARDQMKMVWTNKKRLSFLLMHDTKGDDWFQDLPPAEPQWMKNIEHLAAGKSGDTGSAKYFLSAIASPQVEFAKGGNENLARDVASLKQWLHYVFLVGVEHVYLCDCYSKSHYSLAKYVKKFQDLGLLTYKTVPFNSSAGITLQQAQAKCQEDLKPVLDKDTEWLMYSNILEYPFVKNDPTEGSVARHLKYLVATSDEYTDITAGYARITGPADIQARLVIERSMHLDALEPEHQIAPFYKPKSRKPVKNPDHNNENEVGEKEEYSMVVKPLKSDQFILVYYLEAIKDPADTYNQEERGVEFKTIAYSFGAKLGASLLRMDEDDDALLPIG